MMIEEIIDRFRLKQEREDYINIHNNIEKDISFKGTNLWILIFAILIASVGLNVNSTAVIIGAMLVSPLMGPIIGMGYSLTTYDFKLLNRAVYNFTFAVITSLLASTAYFLVTPLNDAHSELLARTSPSIYDVLIALFGGLAGIVAIASKQKGNVIPGVAIATALMPPLCTAGYGLATAQWNFFFGALYLFTINTVFIAFATMITTRFLKFPISIDINEKYKKQANRWVTTIVLLTIIPSIYFGYGLVVKDSFYRNSSNFIKNVTFIEDVYLLRSDVDYSKNEIKLVYGGKRLTDDQKDIIRQQADIFSLKEVSILFQQGFAINDNNGELQEVIRLKTEINRLTSLLQTQSQRNDSSMFNEDLERQVFNEIKLLFPEIISFSVTKTNIYRVDNNIKQIHIVYIVSSDVEKSKNEINRLKEWFRVRLNSDNVKIFIE